MDRRPTKRGKFVFNDVQGGYRFRLEEVRRRGEVMPPALTGSREISTRKEHSI
jgi:hypothetical protein